MIGLSSTQPPRPLMPDIQLDEHYSSFVDAEVKSGKYGSISAVVMAGLRLLEEQNTKLAALRQALVEGEQSGCPQPFDNDAFLKEMHARYGQQ